VADTRSQWHLIGPAIPRQNRLLAYAQLYRALGGGWALTDAQWQGEAATK